MADLWPNYVSMVNGLSRATRAKARGAAQSLLAQAGLEDVAADAGDRVTKLAEEIFAASRANRQLLENLVTAEVDKAATRLGFVRTEDLSEIRAEIAALRAQLTVMMAPVTDPATDPFEAPAWKPPAKKATAKTATAKSAAAEKSPAAQNSPTAKKAPAKRSPAKTVSATTAASPAATEPDA